MLYSLKDFDESGIAKQRMKIIKFYEGYGEKAAIEAFGADRKVISRWRKRLKEGGGMPLALTPYSTRPHKTRTPKTPQEVVDFIRDIRGKHPGLGKEKITPILDKHLKERGIKTISESTVGNIIKRHKLFFPKKTGRVYHNPNSKWAQDGVKKKKRLRVKHLPKPKDFGHIVSDTITRITDGVKDYFYCAIDAKLKFAITLNYKRLTSRKMKDFYLIFKSVYPGEIKAWQSDNGAEHLGEFDEHLKKEGIPHYFSYPNCPKINAYIERYNRTVQEEFIDMHEDIIHDKTLFHQKLADYLIFYNTQRPHKSLGLKSLIDYLIEHGKMSQMCLTYTAI
jgi:transposase